MAVYGQQLSEKVSKRWRDSRIMTTSKNVKHGCASCAYKDAPVTKEPCKSCERWSNWEDKDD